MISTRIRECIDLFFENLYDIRLEIKEYYVDIEGGVHGTHDDEYVYINRSLSKIDQEMATVHEKNHIYQLNGYSATVPNIKGALIEDESINYFVRKQEIDSRIVELLYAYSQFGDYGIDIFKHRVFYKCTPFNNNVKRAVNNLMDCKVKQALIAEINKYYIESYEYNKII